MPLRFHDLNDASVVRVDRLASNQPCFSTAELRSAPARALRQPRYPLRATEFGEGQTLRALFEGSRASNANDLTFERVKDGKHVFLGHLIDAVLVQRA